MRAAIVLFALAGTASAQEVECPKRLPGLEAPKARLTGGGMYMGADKRRELIGDRVKVPGGVDVRYGSSWQPPGA